jgi:hypothetical protein
MLDRSKYSTTFEKGKFLFEKKLELSGGPRGLIDISAIGMQPSR